jgi:hypothetical protein
MGHVKQKKSTSSSTSTPPEAMAIEMVNAKEKASHSTREHHHQHHRPSYPEQLNAEELISQINCRSSLNEIANDSNNNSNSNNNTIHRTSNQITHSEAEEIDGDVENGPVRRHHRQRPLYRRVISFIRNLWIGAKFNVGKDGEQNLLNYSHTWKRYTIKTVVDLHFPSFISKVGNFIAFVA